MTIKIIDKRTGEELSLREFGVKATPNSIVFGWECMDAYLSDYEVTFPEVEQEYKALQKRFFASNRCIAEQEKEINQLKQRIADLELEVAGQQKFIEENMGFGSEVIDIRKPT